MSDESESDGARLVCEGCGHYEMVKDDNGEETRRLVGRKDVQCEHESNARLLARIHRIKTGHSPRVVG